MRSNLRMTLALSLCLGLALWVAAPTAQNLCAQAAALVRLSPAELEVADGETATVEVRVEDVADLYGFDVRLGFDPSIVEVVDADLDSPGTQLRPGDLLSLDFVVKNVADSAEGTAWFAMTQLNPSEAVSGSGTAFSVTFRGKRVGSTALDITYTQLANRKGEEIPASTEGGAIQVVASGEASPDATEPSSQTSASPTPAATQPPVQQPTLVTPTPTIAGTEQEGAATVTTPSATQTATELAAEDDEPSGVPTAVEGTPEAEPLSSPTPAAAVAVESSASPAASDADISTATSPVIGEKDLSAATQTPTALSSNTRAADNGSGPSTAAIVAVVSGVLGAALLLTGLIAILQRPRRDGPQ